MDSHRLTRSINLKKMNDYISIIEEKYPFMKEGDTIIVSYKLNLPNISNLIDNKSKNNHYDISYIEKENNNHVYKSVYMFDNIDNLYIEKEDTLFIAIDSEIQTDFGLEQRIKKEYFLASLHFYRLVFYYIFFIY